MPRVKREKCRGNGKLIFNSKEEARDYLRDHFRPRHGGYGKAHWCVWSSDPHYHVTEGHLGRRRKRNHTK